MIEKYPALSLAVTSRVSGKATRTSWLQTKFLVLLFLMGFFIQTGYSQVANYGFAPISGTFTPLVGGTTTGLAAAADDTMSAAFNIGFNFTYNSIVYTQVMASSNGPLLFGTGRAQSATNDLATSTAAQRPGVAPLWDDLLCNSGVTYQLSGSSPNRILTVEWLNMKWNYQAAGAVISFQVKLYETTNVIDFVYRNDATGYNAGSTGGGSIGIMGVTTSDFRSFSTTTAAPTTSTSTSTNNLTTKPVTGQIYRFTPLVCGAMPSALTSSALTTTTATISWTAASPAPSAGYTYEVRTSGAAGSGATGLAASGSTAAGVVTKNITGLTVATVYSYYVRSFCGGTDFSTWTSAGTFTTLCNNSTLPFTEGFNVGATTSNNQPCWSQQFVSGSLAIYQTISSPGTGGTSPLPALFEGSGMIFYNTYSNSTSTRLVSPPLTTTGTASVDVNFQWYYSVSGGTGSYLTEGVTVQWSTDGVTWNDFTGNFIRRYGATTGWAPVTLTLPAGAGNIVKLYVGFKLTGNAGYDTYMDKVNILAAPTCLPSATLSSSAITTTTATISWNAASTVPANGYEYYLSTSSTAPTAGTTATGSTAAGVLTKALAGLLPSSTYFYWIRSVCSGIDSSAWSTGSSFATTCATITTFPYNEGFEGIATANTLPACMTASPTVAASGKTQTYTAAATGTNAALTPRTGAKFASVYYSPNAKGSFFTPALQLSAGATYTASVYYITDGVAWPTVRLVFGTSATQAAMTTVIASVSNGSATTYTQITGTFTVPSTGVYYVAFEADNTSTNAPNYCSFDDLQVNISPATITGFTPSAVCANGTNSERTVAITGSNLLGATAVSFNGTAAQSFVVNSTTSITAIVPTIATTGAITIVTPASGTATSGTSMTINPAPTVANITGPTSVCLPNTNTITLVDTTPTGAWSSSNVDVATVSGSGIVTPVAIGSVTISYTVTASGCTTIKTYGIAVNAPVVILSSTPSQFAAEFTGTTFVVSASGTGSPSLTYVWEVSTDGAETWSTVTDGGNYSTSTTGTLTISNIPASFNEYLYQCTVTGICNTLTSDVAILYVGDTGISTQPVSQNICDSGAGTASFTVVGSPDVVSYQWQEDQGGDNWLPLSDGGIYSGATVATLSLTGLTSINSGWRYKCTVTGNASAESNPATLTVIASPSVSTPANRQTCYSGGSSIFTTVGTGGISSYQWKYGTSATGPFTAVTAGTPVGATYSGTTTGSLTVNTTSATPAAGTYYYQVTAIGTSPCANAVSTGAARLTIYTPVVSVTPSSATYCNPGTAVSLTASGGVSYVWSPSAGLSATTGTTVTASPAATTTYTVIGTDGAGCTGTTTVTVTLAAGVTATATSNVSTTCANGLVQLTGTATQGPTQAAVGSYTFTTSSSPYVALTGATTFDPSAASVGTADDGYSNLQNIGFTFNFGGTNFTTFSANTNGYLRLGALPTSTQNYAAISLGDSNIIAFNGRDLHTATAIYSLVTEGTAPNRICKMQAANFYQYNTATYTGNAQVWLYEGSNKVEFHYGAYANTWDSATTQIGIKGATTGAADVRAIQAATFAGITAASITTSSTATVTQGTTNQVTSGTVYSFSPGGITTGFTYAWTANPVGTMSSTTIANPTANPAVTTTYTMVATSSTTGCNNSAAVTVTVQSDAVIGTQPVASIVCQGSAISVSVAATGPGLTYQWYRNGVVVAGATTATYNVASATTANSGNYYVIVHPTCGNDATSSTVVLTVNPTPTATAPAAQSYCDGATAAAIVLAGTPSGVTFDITGGAAVGLGDISGVTSIPSFTAIAGSATVSITPNANGCPGTAVTYLITVNALPSVVSITPASSTNCANGAPILLTASGGVSAISTLQNFSAASLPSGWVAVQGSGDTVAVSTTASAGGAANEIKMTGNSQATVITDILSYGPINTVGLTTINMSWNNWMDWYSSSYNYNIKIQTSTDRVTWHNTTWITNPVTADIGPGLQTLVINTADVGSATLYVAFTMNGLTFGANAWYIDNVTINSSAQAPVTWTSNVANSFCNAAGTIFTSTASGLTTYVRPSTTATITATATSGAGCPRTQTSVITVNPTPTATAPGAQVYCKNISASAILLAGTPSGVTFDISGGAAIGLANQTGLTSIPSFSPTASGSATISITPKANGCTGTAVTYVITVNPTSVGGTAAAVASTLCQGGSTTINLTGQTGTIQWQQSANGVSGWSDISGATAASYGTGALSTTTYYMAVVTSGVCSLQNSSVTSVTVNPTSVAGTAAATAAVVCNGTGTSINLTGQTGTIQWQQSANGTSGWSDISGATSAIYSTPNLSATTYYRANVTSGLCSTATSNTASVTVNANVVYYADADADTYGNISVASTSCMGAPIGYVADGTDCNDADATKHATYTSFYTDGDNDGYGTGSVQTVCAVDAATAPTGYSVNATDCNDSNNAVYQSALLYADLDGDGYDSSSQVTCYGAVVPAGHSLTTNGADCNDTNASMHTTYSYYSDADADGYGTGTAVLLCSSSASSVPAGNSLIGGDCNDTSAAVNPGHAEIGYNLIDDDCDGLIDEGFPPQNTVVQGGACGTVLSQIDSYVYANIVAGAQGYNWRVTTMSGPTAGMVQYTSTYLRNLRITSLGTYAFNTAYKVEVSVQYAGYPQPYTTSNCTVSTPETKTQLTNCGGTINNMSDVIYASIVPFATGYRFRVTNILDPLDTQTIDRQLREFRMSLILNAQYNSTYTVEVAVRNTDGNYLGYGPVCTVSTPIYPTTQLQESQCELELIPTMSTILYADGYSGAHGYRFRLINVALGYSQTVDRVLRTFSLNNFTGLLAGQTYKVQVSLLLNDVYGPYGKACSVTVPGAARLNEMAAPIEVGVFTAKAYPNPFASSFKLDIDTSSEERVEVKVYDMIGKLVEVRQVTVSELSNQEVGERYPSGVYNIVVSQGGNVKTLRVIKR